MRIIPNMTVIIPADGNEMRAIMKTLPKTKGPVYVRTSRMKFPVIYPTDKTFIPGEGDILRDGKDLTIIAVGLLVSEALKAADILQDKGISARVVNLSTIKPIDRNLIIACARETGAIVTAEEHSIIGGLGSAVAEVLAENAPVPMRMLGVRDRFGMSGTSDALLDCYGLRAVDIVRLSEDLLKQEIYSKR
jgi:transketolase